MQTWSTAVESTDAPRGTRWRGVSYVTHGPDTRGGAPAPRGAIVTYRTRALQSRNEARELARSRTIHHNLYHVESAAGHLARYCHERA